MSRPVGRAEEEELATSLPDTPTTFGPRCVLLRHSGRAWAIGPLSRPRAAVVQAAWLPREVMAFGEDVTEIGHLLRSVSGWDAVHCRDELAEPLGRAISRDFGWPTRKVRDLYFTLDDPPAVFRHPAVRRLSESDLALIEAAPPELGLAGFDSPLAALSGGVAAGAVVEGQLVGLVSMTVSSEMHADLAAAVLEPWRRRGIARAAASLVAAEVQARGLRPVWSTGEENLASQAVARAVGFREHGTMAYVVVPSLQRAGGFDPTHGR